METLNSRIHGKTAEIKTCRHHQLAQCELAGKLNFIICIQGENYTTLSAMSLPSQCGGSLRSHPETRPIACALPDNGRNHAL